MNTANRPTPWGGAPDELVPPESRMAHVRESSPFVAALLDRHPDWAADLDARVPPGPAERDAAVAAHGLDGGLRYFRNHQMARIIWRDLTGLADLDETFADLTALAELCLDGALDAHFERLADKHGEPRDADGAPQRLSVIGLGKFGGGELNLSSDIDVIFVIPGGGETAGGNGRPLPNETFFTRQARAVIATLSDVTAEGFCFRVDTRLRPFGDASPLCSSLPALEQYYQREGRDWERYALIKARPVGGDRRLGDELVRLVRPFVYRRYIDFTAVEALQEMHANVREDARKRDRLDDIKRGPGGIREIEFLAQCFQLLRGGREPGLQTSSLAAALDAIGELGLMESDALTELRSDYLFLRQIENRIQAQHDRQEHRVPGGDDRARLARAMRLDGPAELDRRLAEVRGRVQSRFRDVLPAPSAPEPEIPAANAWRAARDADGEAGDTPLDHFIRSLDRLALSQRADRRLNDLMPHLIQRLDERPLDITTQHRIFDLLLAICRRSAYLLLLSQNPAALDRLIDLFARSEWIADKVTRFPALLDELIDPSLGRQIPLEAELDQSVTRLLRADQGPEAALNGLNYLRLATALRIAVALLQENLTGEAAQAALAALAGAMLRGVLALACGELEHRHGRIGRFSGDDGDDPDTPPRIDTPTNSMAVIAYGSLGAREPGFDSDLDIVFLFRGDDRPSDGDRSLPAERYYARLAQRVLSLLTAMTPSGRLYAVDTRLRPNGRAGSLVSSLEAFGEYQKRDAWTWELQALTRARPVAGHRDTGAHFERIRAETLAVKRNPEALRGDLAEMRARIERELGQGQGAGDRVKRGRGGLIDIEFIVQYGVLARAAESPRVIRSTESLEQLAALVDCGWIDRDDAALLDRSARLLRHHRMLSAVSDPPAELLESHDPLAVRAVFERLIGEA